MTKTRIVIEQDAIDQFDDQIKKILEILEQPYALVTDLSQVVDFLPCMVVGMDQDELDAAQAEEDRMIGELTGLLNQHVGINDLLWVLARELYHQENAIANEAKQKSRPH